MSIKFGNDGTLYCNTIKYNYKQARNMIADNSYGNISSSNVWVNVLPSTDPAGYKSFRSFKIEKNKFLIQSLPTFVAGHKYYFSYRYQSQGLTLNAGVGIQTSSGSDFAGSWLDTSSTTWVLNSQIFQVTENKAGCNLVMINKENSLYISRFILIDLTDTFGVGKEPTKEWCDINIREQENFVNFGCVSNNISYNTLSSAYTIDNDAWVDNANYLAVDSSSGVRDYQFYFQTSTSRIECFITSAKSFTLTPSSTYYAYIEENHGFLDRDSLDNVSIDFYFPIEEPLIDQIPLANNKEFNGGGGMNYWKRVSAFGKRSSFSSGSYPMRIDFNNSNKYMHFWVTGINLISLSSVIAQYNSYNKTSISISDVNKEWCDRWIDGRSNPIIHIKDPNNTSIKFNKPIKKLDTFVRNNTTETFENWAALKSDTWSEVLNGSEFKEGDLAYLDCKLLEAEKEIEIRFVVEFLYMEGTTLHCNNLGWSRYNGYWWNLCEGYDISCNDIEIRPELDKISMDQTGTIKCKKLVRNLKY